MRSIDPFFINGTIIRFDKATPINNNGNSEVEPRGQARGTILTPLWSDISRLGSGQAVLSLNIHPRPRPCLHAGVRYDTQAWPSAAGGNDDEDEQKGPGHSQCWPSGYRYQSRGPSCASPFFQRGLKPLLYNSRSYPPVGQSSLCGYPTCIWAPL